MSHSDIIIIVATLAFSSTVGVYATIRYINLHTRPPVNTLVRSGDIELVDYIEPTHPQQIYNYPDLFEPQFPIYERISNYVYFERAPSYQSGTLPSYHTVDRLNINSSLENSINLDYILIILIILCFLILILKLRIKNIIKIKS
jgi:hypothetical protein